MIATMRGSIQAISFDIIASASMLKHKYKSLNYDSFIASAEFFTHSCYIICIYYYSNHKLGDLIYIAYTCIYI